VAVYRDLLKNAVANAETAELNPELFVIDHAQVNRAPAGRRRTFQANGRIAKYAPQPAHTETMLKKVTPAVSKAVGEGPPKKITKKQAPRRRFVGVAI
jgi:large subunit ribosomal protein L17e